MTVHHGVVATDYTHEVTQLLSLQMTLTRLFTEYATRTLGRFAGY